MFKRPLIFLVSCFMLATASFGQSGISYIAPRDAKIINAVVASSNYTSSSKEVLRFKTGSLQVVWASLTGSVDGTVKVQVSNDCTSSWTDKSGASVTLSGASGNDVISIANLTEACVRAVYTKNSITGGTITALLSAKG